MTSKVGLFFLLLLVSVSSFANLSISPNRVVFSDRDRVATLMLLNGGSEPVSYRLQWQHLQFNNDGELVESNNSLQTMLSEMTRISPRQVTLAPNERQVVKLAIRKPKDLPNQEFRSYLNLAAQPVGTTDEGQDKGIRINLLISYNIPVIVRNTSEIPEVSFEKPSTTVDNRITVTLNRTGLTSSSGNLVVLRHLADGKKQEIARINGANVYAEQASSRFDIPLFEAESNTPLKGTFTVRYEGSEQYKNHTFAESVFSL